MTVHLNKESTVKPIDLEKYLIGSDEFNNIIKSTKHTVKGSDNYSYLNFGVKGSGRSIKLKFPMLEQAKVSNQGND